MPVVELRPSPLYVSYVGATRVCVSRVVTIGFVPEATSVLFLRVVNICPSVGEIAVLLPPSYCSVLFMEFPLRP